MRTTWHGASWNLTAQIKIKYLGIELVDFWPTKKIMCRDKYNCFSQKKIRFNVLTIIFLSEQYLKLTLQSIQKIGEMMYAEH